MIDIEDHLHEVTEIVIGIEIMIKIVKRMASVRETTNLKIRCRKDLKLSIQKAQVKKKLILILKKKRMKKQLLKNGEKKEKNC